MHVSATAPVRGKCERGKRVVPVEERMEAFAKAAVCCGSCLAMTAGRVPDKDEVK